MGKKTNDINTLRYLFFTYVITLFAIGLLVYYLGEKYPAVILGIVHPMGPGLAGFIAGLGLGIGLSKRNS